MQLQLPKEDEKTSFEETYWDKSLNRKGNYSLEAIPSYLGELRSMGFNMDLLEAEFMRLMKLHNISI